MKNVQIPYELFVELLRYHLVEDTSCAGEIRRGLEKKLASMVCHELYSKYKTAPTGEEREKARKEYLDKRGVLDCFRW
ncbi:MAG: complexin-2 [Bacteroides sp.]|nr:complexin-2 [Bacteroides sp.]